MLLGIEAIIVGLLARVCRSTMCTNADTNPCRFRGNSGQGLGAAMGKGDRNDNMRLQSMRAALDRATLTLELAQARFKQAYETGRMIGQELHNGRP